MGNVNIEKVEGYKTFYHVVIGDELVAELYQPLYKRHIKTIEKFQEERELRDYIEEVEKKVCFSYLMFLLGKRALFRKEIEDKLKMRKFSNCGINTAITKALDYGYINDLELAKSITRINRKKKGPKFIEQTLKKRGCAEEIIHKVIHLSKDMQKDALAELVKKKYPTFTQMEFKEKQKVFQKLLRKGFELEEIRVTLANWQEK